MEPRLSRFFDCWEQTMKIKEILDWLDEQNREYQFLGEREAQIEGFSSLGHYKENTLTWIKGEKNLSAFENTEKIQLAVAQTGLSLKCKNVIFAVNSKELFFEILEKFWGTGKQKTSVGAGTYLSPDVKIGKNVVIRNNCVIKGEIVIGDGTIIEDSVVILNRVEIGKNCYIQSLAVIGEDGFGYYEEKNGTKTMIKHHGGVIVEDDVFIGAHVNIARGTIDDTIVRAGVKIAPSTHIGHNNHIGKNAVVICSRLFGSAQIGENAYIVSSTVRNQCKIGRNTMVGMGSIVTKDIEDNKVVIGAPAKIIRDNG